MEPLLKMDKFLKLSSTLDLNLTELSEKKHIKVLPQVVSGVASEKMLVMP